MACVCQARALREIDVRAKALVRLGSRLKHSPEMSSLRRRLQHPCDVEISPDSIVIR